MRSIVDVLLPWRRRRGDGHVPSRVVERTIAKLEREDKELDQRIKSLETVVEARYDLMHRDRDAP